MSGELWTFLGVCVTALLGFAGLVYKTNKTTRSQQIEQIKNFQKDTRTEMSRIQDAYADSIVEVKNLISDLASKQDKMQTVIELRLDALEKKQDKHNSVIERTYKLEQQVAVLNNREKVSENRLNDLERHEEQGK